MADLIAQGADSRHRWRRVLLAERDIVLGRAGTWPAPWDDRISRRHAELRWDGARLHVRRLSDARNPIFFKGLPTEDFTLAAGEHFVIGETTFTLANERVNVSLNIPVPVEEQSFSTEYLHNLPFRRVGPHIDVLSRLPEVIAGAGSDAELSVRLVNLLLGGLPRAGAAALVAVREDDSNAAIEVLHWDRRNMSAGDFQPSQRLILDALARNESVLHVWNTAQGGTSSDFTVNQGVDWAFCTPVAGQACGGWALYVAGRFTGGAGFGRTDLRSARSARRPEIHRTGRHDAGGAVRRAAARTATRRAEPVFCRAGARSLAGDDPEDVLAPREADVTRAVLRSAWLLAQQRTIGRRSAGTA